MSSETSPQPNDHKPLALAAFALRAEDEPWLDACFVPPQDFDLILGARSALVFGEPGSGKTALYRMLLRRLRPPDRKPNRLIVEWRPGPLLPNTPADSPIAEVMLDRVLAACVIELSRHITRWPAELQNVPDDVLNTLAWFAQRYVASGSVSGPLARPAHDDFLDQAAPQYRIAELVKALGEIGLAGVCVFVGPDELGAFEVVQPGLRALLSSLNLFEQPRFVYKLVLPAELGCHLLTVSGVERRRLQVFELRWLEHELTEIVERRLALASGGKAQRLSDVCEDVQWTEWLVQYGGNIPRGWLEQARPLVAHYLAQGRPLTTQEWAKIRQHRPPRLSLDLKTGRVTIGQRELPNLGQAEMALLRYLYEHRDRVCTRDELYHKAYVPVMSPKLVGQRALPKEYEGVLDTTLWRLREAIEPDPRRPVYVITRRREGVILENAW